jgi:predicted phage tail protein
MSQLCEVRLYGELGRRFGRVHMLAVSSVAEAVRALRANFPAIERFLLDHPHGFHILAGRDDRANADRLTDPVSTAETIKIIPATAGSKGGLLQTILGAVLVVVGVVTGQLWLVQIGAGLVLGGIAQMLTPTPKYETGSDEEQRQSYIFSGPVNTSAQGTAVPVGYGRMIVGSIVASMGLTVQELPT